jgi:hypothetical protein
MSPPYLLYSKRCHFLFVPKKISITTCIFIEFVVLYCGKTHTAYAFGDGGNFFARSGG